MDINNTPANEALAYIKSIEDKDTLKKLATELGITFSGNTGTNTLKNKLISHFEESENEEEEKPSLFDVAPVQDGAENEAERIQKANEAAAVQAEKEAQEEKVKAEKAEEERLALIQKVKDEEAALEAERKEAEAIQVGSIPTGAKPIPKAKLLKMDAVHEKNPLIRRQIIRAKAMKLVRCNIQCLDPAETNVPGNIITVYTKYTGKVSKFVPNGGEAAQSYHIPQIIFDHLKAKKFVLRSEKKSDKFGIKKYNTNLVPKYSLEVLEPLTPEELKSLGQKQAAEGLIDE